MPDQDPQIGSGEVKQLPQMSLPKFGQDPQAQPPQTLGQSAPPPASQPLSQTKLSFSKILSGVLGKVVHKEMTQDVTQKAKEAGIYLKAIGNNPSPDEMKILLEKLQKVYPTKGGKETFGKVTQLLGGLTSWRTAEGRNRQAAQQSQQSQQQAQMAQTTQIQQAEDSRAQATQGAEDKRNQDRIEGENKRSEEDRAARGQAEKDRLAAEEARAGAAQKVAAQAKLDAQKLEDDQAEARAAEITKTDPAAAKTFRDEYNNKKFLGTPNPGGQGKDSKNIPGDKLPKDSKDAFGNEIDPKMAYTQRKDGKFVPEAPPPKTGTADNPEVKERIQAYIDQGLDPDTAGKKARSDWVRNENNKATLVNNRAGDSTPKLVPDEDLRELAKTQVITGQKVAAGLFGLRANDPNRTQYARLLAEEYRNSPDYLAIQSAFKAGNANMLQLKKLRGMIGAFETNFQLDLKNANEAADDVPRTGAPAFNKFEQMIEANLTDYPELAKFRDYTNTAANTYAKIVSSGTGGGVSTDSARADAYRLINITLGKKSYKASIEALRKDAENRLKGIDLEIEKQENQQKNRGANLLGTPGAAGATGATGPKPKTADEFLKKNKQ